jgi:S1-C subfamily serine protease
VNVRGVVWWLLCAFLPLAPSGAEAPRAVKTLAEAEMAQVQLVTIRRGGDGSAVARGSAFYAEAGGLLLTCAHVLDHMPKDEVHRLRLHDGSERRFTVLKVDREVDVAVLYSDRPAFFELDPRPLPEIGQVVRLGGLAARRAPDGSAAIVFRPAAVVALERRWATGARRTVGSRRRVVSIKVDEVADPGQSGGPLLAEGTLAVVGVLRSNLETATGGLGGRPAAGFGAAVPMQYVQPLLAPD